ncbi:MAG: GerW family sporulation protein [Oscillospiraceae bacterium]
MSEHPILGLMGTTMEKIRELVDVDTIIGDPIVLKDGITIIPVSKVSFGFAAGGSDLPTKVSPDLFGGGSGAGVSINPLAFIVVSNGEVKLLQMSANSSTPNAIVNLVPEVFDKISSLFSKGEAKTEAKTEEKFEEKPSQKK